jgi:serine/threonine protein kinase
LFQGDVKVFDFGLAKEMKDEDREGSLYNLSANTGSLRYMAPEVALGKPYNEKVDIFSFAVLLWQMLALETPFENYNVSKHSDLVVHGNQRPPIDEKWPESLKKLFAESWSPNISDRPDCQGVMDVLRLEFNPYLGESEVSALDISNKTARSMENY